MPYRVIFILKMYWKHSAKDHLDKMTPNPAWLYTSPEIISWVTLINCRQFDVMSWNSRIEVSSHRIQDTGNGIGDTQICPTPFRPGKSCEHSLALSSFYISVTDQTIISSFQESGLVFVLCRVFGMPSLGLISSPSCKDEKSCFSYHSCHLEDPLCFTPPHKKPICAQISWWNTSLVFCLHFFNFLWLQFLSLDSLLLHQALLFHILLCWLHLSS